MSPECIPASVFCRQVGTRTKEKALKNEHLYPYNLQNALLSVSTGNQSFTTKF